MIGSIHTRVNAVIVNYGTPDLTRIAAWSLFSLYPKLKIWILENGSVDDSLHHLQLLTSDIPTVDILESRKNIHHGPGLDLVIRSLECDWVLIFDSDCIAYRGFFIEKMLGQAEAHQAYMIGEKCRIDHLGYNVTSDYSGEVFDYVHPKCALVNRALYLKLSPFEKHGAPCLKNEKQAVSQGNLLLHFPVDDYVFHLGRGTARTYGYGLGPKGWWLKLRHRLKM